MEEKEFPNEYSNLNSDDVSKELETITNNKENVPSKREGVVHTFAKDVAEEMKSNNASVIKIALAEQERQREYQIIVHKEKKQKVLYLVFIFILVMGGAILLASAFNSKNKIIPIPESSQTKANSIIFSEEQILFTVDDFSRAEFIQSIRQKIDFIKTNGITNILTIKNDETGRLRTLYGSEFLKLIAPNIPQDFLQQIKDNFMIGVDEGHKYSTFIIVTFRDFDKTLQYMREWEPFLLQDTITLMSADISDASIFTQFFQSEIINNKESRVLRDKNQGFVLGYTFMDRSTLVISSNEATISEVLKRYSIQSIK